MQARELVHLSALVSFHGSSLIERPGSISAAGVERYWSASKCRLDRWGIELKDHVRRATGATVVERETLWNGISWVLEEILACEILTRVWGAVLCGYDRRRGTNEADPLGRSVLIGHLEARHRALNLILHGPGISSQHAVHLNRLRRRAERWTDLLVAHLLDSADVAEFAMHPERARQYAVELGPRLGPARRLRWAVLMGSVRVAFQHNFQVESRNADLNADLAAGIMGCFPAGLFDDSGLLRPMWLERMMNTTDDAQGLLAELFQDDGLPAQTVAQRDLGMLRFDRGRPRHGL